MNQSNQKICKPCYFFNTGGCYHDDGRAKSAAECRYLHIKVDKPMEKPQHLKAPCKYYHLRGHCTNKYCGFGHSEIPIERWKKYFPDDMYPGKNYNDDYIWDRTSFSAQTPL